MMAAIAEGSGGEVGEDDFAGTGSLREDLPAGFLGFGDGNPPMSGVGRLGNGDGERPEEWEAAPEGPMVAIRG